MLSNKRSLELESEWNKRMREYRCGSVSSKEVKKMECGRRKHALNQLRQSQTVGSLKRLQIDYMDFCAKLARIVRLRPWADMPPK